MNRRLGTSDLHPELRSRFRLTNHSPVLPGRVLTLMQAFSHLRLRPRIPAGMQYRYLEPAGGEGIHCYTPAGDYFPACLLWIHGGGMVVGKAAQDHARCFRVARELGIAVVSAEYRLAPRHPFPAALDDCHAAWEWIRASSGELGIDVDRIAIGGQSAGGGLAAGLVQRIHDGGGAQPAAQWLFCPMLDDRTASNRELDGRRHHIWNNKLNRAGWTAYLTGPPGGPNTPDYAAPARRQDCQGLPPAWIGTGDIELFHDENRRYAEKLNSAGVPCVIDVVPGAPHAFESFSAKTPIGRAYLNRAQSWLAAQLGLRS